MSHETVASTEEVWKPDILTEFEGLEVSSLGRIRTTDITVPQRRPNGTIVGYRVRGRVLSPFFNKKGYPMVSVERGGVKRNFATHRLVCAAFHGPPPFPEADVCHENNDRADSRPENLRWDTRRNNMLDKWRHGTAQIGERHGNAKLTQAQVIRLRQAAAAGLRFWDAPEAQCGSHTGIWRAVTGRSWKHLPHFTLDGAPVKLKPGGPFGNLNAIGGKAARR